MIEEAHGDAHDDDWRESQADRAWDMLDLLPKGAPHPSLTSTTIEMAAVTTAEAGGRMGKTSFRADGQRWAIAGVIVAASLAAGFVAGSTQRPPVGGSPAVLAAVDRHLPVLREAGTLDFLEAIARRGPPLPRRFSRPPRGGPADEPPEIEPYPQLDAAVDDFRAAFFVAGEPPPRRPWPPDRIPAVERLSANELRSLMATARALGDPSRPELVEAAKAWHQWVIASDPVERRILPTLGTKERLEWIERRSRPWRRP